MSTRYKITEDWLRDFANRLTQVEWADVIASNQPDQAFIEFYDQFIFEFYAHFPRVNCTKCDKRDKPCFNNNLRIMVRDKNKAYCKYRNILNDYNKGI